MNDDAAMPDKVSPREWLKAEMKLSNALVDSLAKRVTCGSDGKCTPDEILKILLAEIRARQPVAEAETGPELDSREALFHILHFAREQALVVEAYLLTERQVGKPDPATVAALLSLGGTYILGQPAELYIMRKVTEAAMKEENLELARRIADYLLRTRLTWGASAATVIQLWGDVAIKKGPTDSDTRILQSLGNKAVDACDTTAVGVVSVLIESIEKLRHAKSKRACEPLECFAGMTDLTWEKVTFEGVSLDKVSISAMGKQQEVRFIDLGFVDNRNGKADSSWRALLDLLWNEGTVHDQSDRVSSERFKQFKAGLRVLRPRLKILMGLQADPFLDCKQGNYTTRFKCLKGKLSGNDRDSSPEV